MAINPLFTWADYLVVALVLIFSAAVGFYYAFTGGKQKTTKEFLLADRSMHWFPVAVSLSASYLSGQSMIGLPSEIYSYGTIFGYGMLTTPFAAVIAHALYLPVFRTIKVTSVYEYAGLRFGKEIELIAMMSSTLGMLLYTALLLYVPSLTFSQATGLDLWVSVGLLATVASLYTVMGGLKAVLWADTIQFIIMLGGFLAVIIKGVIHEGGLTSVWEVNKRSGRLDFMVAEKAFDLDPRARHTFWSQFFAGLIMWSAVMGTDQTAIQRFQALKTHKDSVLVYGLASLSLATFTFAGILVGLVIFSYFRFCDPISSGQIFTKDQLYPLFVLEIFMEQPGMSGLVLSSVLSASLSSVSSLLTSISAVILQDVVKLVRPTIAENNAAIASKVICIIVSSVSVTLVAFARYYGHGVLSMGIAFSGITFGPTLAMFSLGVLNPIANRKGVLVGFVTALLISGWKGMGGLIHKPYVYEYPVTTIGCNVTDPSDLANLTSPIYDPSTWNPTQHYRSGVNTLYDISYSWNGLWGIVITWIVTTAVSPLLRWMQGGAEFNI